MKVKGAIFDLDGTLLDSASVWEQIDIDFLGRHGLEVPDDYVENIIPMAFGEAAEYTIARFGLKASKDEVMAEWNQMAYEAYAEHIGLLPGVEKVLQWFRSEKIPIGVATSNNAALFVPCLKRNGIYSYFHSFTETSEVNRGKEYPDVYIKEAKKLGCQPDECLVFEDIIPAMKSARDGGFISIGVQEKAWKYDRTEVETSCHYYIEQISDALSLLKNRK